MRMVEKGIQQQRVELTYLEAPFYNIMIVSMSGTGLCKAMEQNEDISQCIVNVKLQHLVVVHH